LILPEKLIEDLLFDVMLTFFTSEN
jgi:hypothetical protein